MQILRQIFFRCADMALLHFPCGKLFIFLNFGYSKADPAENGSIRPGQDILFSVRLCEFLKDGSADDYFPASSITF